MPGTTSFLVDSIQLLAVVTEAHTMPALKRPGEVLFTRGVAWVEARLGQEHRDRDPTPFQANLQLPVNATRTHAVGVQTLTVVLDYHHQSIKVPSHSTNACQTAHCTVSIYK